MNRLRFAIAAGFVFGIVDVLPMFGMEFTSKPAAVTGAFVNRFAIGFLIPVVSLPVAAWLRGLIVGLLLSLPYAIITGSWAPILAGGVIGGVVIGFLAGRERRRRAGTEVASPAPASGEGRSQTR